jgi:hypothetical protein
MNRTACFPFLFEFANCDKVRSQNYARLFKIVHFWKTMGPSSILNLIVDVNTIALTTGSVSAIGMFQQLRSFLRIKQHGTAMSVKRGRAYL